MQAEATGRRGNRVRHHACIAVVVDLATHGVGELCGEVEAAEAERGAKATVEVWVRVAAEVVVRIRESVRRLLFAGRLVGVVPQRLAFGGQTCKAMDAPGVDGQAFTVVTDAIHIASVSALVVRLLLFWQVRDLVLVVCQVEVDGPDQILTLDGRVVEVEFDTAVNHVANVVVIAVVTQ